MNLLGNEMTARKIITALIRTRTSINNAVKRAGGEAFVSKGPSEGALKAAIEPLIDRYQDLRDVAKSFEGVWERYCEETGAAESHDAYDLLA